METTIQTRDQIRAQLVFKAIKTIEPNETLSKDYGALALSAPTLIRISGLVQTLAFYKAKAKSNQNKAKPKCHHEKFINHLSDELKSINMLPKNADIFDFVINCDLTAYMRLTYETLALCQWHKRFAQSVLKAESGGGD